MTTTPLFTDVEGSTRLLHELGDGYTAVLAEHRRALREAFAAHGVYASGRLCAGGKKRARARV